MAAKTGNSYISRTISVGVEIQQVTVTSTETENGKMSAKTATFQLPVVGSCRSCLTHFHRARRCQRPQMYRWNFELLYFQRSVLAAILIVRVIDR